MPLGRFKVRNEYGLGVKELYKEGVECEDPKLVLDGVAVSGLVGLLRQLGDLSQFAAEVFHGLQEQVASTVSRSRKLVTRVQRVEASLPSLEKAILSQTSHIHFAYSPGSEWHPRIKNEQNHFICDDLPHFIMDSYEECHEPPRLQLLDRFDTGGPGSCLKRYSDPTFFRQASASFEAHYRDKSHRVRKARKIKRRKSRQRSGLIPNNAPDMNNRVQISSKTGQGEPSVSFTSSTFDRSSRSDLGDQSDFLASKISALPDKTQYKELFSTLDENMVDPIQTIYLKENNDVAFKGIQGEFSTDTTEPPSSDITWDEKLEIMEHMGLHYGIENAQNATETTYHPVQVLKPVVAESIDQVDDLSDNGSITKSVPNEHYTKEIMNMNLIESTGVDYLHEQDLKTDDAKISQVDGLSEVTSCSESDADGHCVRTTIDEKFVESSGLSYLHEQEVKPINGKISDHGSSSESSSHGIDEVQDLDESNFDLHEHDLVQTYHEPSSQVTNFSRGENTSHEDGLVLANLNSFPPLTAFCEGENSPKLITNGNFLSASFDNKLRIGDVQYMIDTIENDKWAIQTFEAEPVAEFSKGGNSHDSIANDNFMSDLADNKLPISDGRYMVETNLENAKMKAGTINAECDDPTDTSTKEVNKENLIEWPLHDDTDSGTDNFVDARYTIDSESECEYETQPREEVQTITCTLPVKASTDLVDEKIDHDGVYDVSERPTSPLSLPNTENHENAVSSQLSESQEHQSPPLSTVSQGIEVCADTDELRPEPVESTLQNSLDNKTACEPRVSEAIPFGSTSSYPHAFWTNGTLFGFQPSKPTVISTSNSAPMSCGNDTIVDQCSSKFNGPGSTISSSVKNYNHGDDIESNSQDVGSLRYVPHDERNTDDDSAILGPRSGHVTIQDNKFPSSTDLRSVYSEGNNRSEDKSSLFSLLSRNILKDGLRRIGSLEYDDKDKPNDPLNAKLQSSVNSPPPSPPLEHMKISFRPIDGFETSRLKLKYPEGVGNHESTVETFPSFQLVPEPTGLHNDMGSDSDDDTFCRSYPCISEDSVAHLSDSDSEQWESGDTSESNDHAFYDGFRRISSTESASSSPQNDETRQNVGSRSFSLSGPTSESPILGINNNTVHQVLKSQLPPLPPLQWCVSKPVLEKLEDKTEKGSQTSDFAISRPDVDDLNKLQERTKESDIVKQEKVAEAKMHDQKVNSPATEGKTVDDHGDILHQIRTKSFNLKRTEAARSLHTPSVSTNNKITAILQKASAIRQAVASDDDSWSDT